MSVSWQPSAHASVPLGVRLGAPSTSSSDYGNWFQPKTFPTPPMNPFATGQRRIPTRKLGALAISDHTDGSGGGGGQRDGGGTETMDQTGRVNSFLSKVTQEGRSPRSPITPELLDLPGRIVRAPRTRHMTPRNSPDAARHAEINGHQEGSYYSSGPNAYSGSQGPNGQNFMPSPRQAMERSNTMVDISPRVHGELPPSTITSQALRQQNPFTLQRANTMMPQGNNTNQYLGNTPGQFSQFPAHNTGSNANQYQRPLQPMSGFPQYVVPQYPIERSNTMLNFNTSTGSNTQFNPNVHSVGTNEISPRLLGLQRSTTNLDGSKLSQANGVPGANANDQAENRVSWSFRRVPSFHGNLPGAQNGIMRRPVETFQPVDEPTAESAQNQVLSRYMFTTLPDSNAKKHSADTADMSDSMKPRIPMYWLYGSRGRPGSINREELVSSNTGPWAPANSPRDQLSHHINQPGHIGIDTTPPIAPMQQGQTVSLNNLSESDFLATSTDRRDAYRSNYSSYNDQRTTQSEPDKSEFDGRFRKEDSAAAITAAETASLPDESRKYRSILKKHSSYAGTALGAPQIATGTQPMRAAPGRRLPHMAMHRRGPSSKRVTFAL